jgi:hypothetical protein
LWLDDKVVGINVKAVSVRVRPHYLMSVRQEPGHRTGRARLPTGLLLDYTYPTLYYMAPFNETPA